MDIMAELIRKPCKILEMKESKDDVGSGVAVFATLNVVDLDEEVTLPGAIGEQRVKVLGAHNWSVPWIGRAKTHEDGERVLADFELNLKQSGAREWYEALKFDFDRGPIAEWSYGFHLKEWEYEERDDRQIRVFKSVDVHEVSPVVLGAGLNTGTESVKQRNKDADDLAVWYALEKERFLPWQIENL